MAEIWQYVEIVLFLATPIVFVVWWLARIRAKEQDLLDDTDLRNSQDPRGLYSEGRALMEAAAICEQRRHGRRRGDHLEVEWDQALFPRKSTDVGVHAAWLEREGPKVGIKVVRKNPSPVFLPGGEWE